MLIYRSHTCTELSPSDVDKHVILAGWVHRRRDHGGLIFIDLRDRSGIIQLVFDPDISRESFAMAEEIRSEYVIRIEGKVRSRQEGAFNSNIKTGEIEIEVDELKVLNKSKTPPFEINLPEDSLKNQTSEELRLEYRYLDLRRKKMKENIVLRYKVLKTIRDFFDSHDFLEIETPILVKGTPEGAREYLVPSRLYPGKFFVLPQSPQQMKQLLMISGMDRYFQIAKCFRDEDQRGDRQPEFTQLDLEMSFCRQEDIIQLIEKLLILIVEKYVPAKTILKKPFPVIDYKEAMKKYGSDRPDLRFELEIKDVTHIVKESDFQVFSKAEVVRALKVDQAMFSRKEIDDLTEIAKVYKAKGLAYIIVEDELKSPILKFLTKGEAHLLVKYLEAKKGDIIFFVADEEKTAALALGQVRLEVAKKLNLIDNNLFAFCWVTDFPLFEQTEDGNLTSVHHPFTTPKQEDLELMDKAPLKVRADAYDIVLNGTEIGGGSIRIHERVLQKKIFDVLGISDEDSERRFGHLLKAFEYGAPPHGGLALGLDRLIMILAGEDNIREVIAFPKDGKAKDLMFGAPSDIPEKQVKEANIKIIEDQTHFSLRK